jgi:hypothetical protein
VTGRQSSTPQRQANNSIIRGDTRDTANSKREDATNRDTGNLRDGTLNREQLAELEKINSEYEQKIASEEARIKSEWEANEAIEITRINQQYSLDLKSLSAEQTEQLNTLDSATRELVLRDIKESKERSVNNYIGELIKEGYTLKTDINSGAPINISYKYFDTEPNSQERLTEIYKQVTGTDYTPENEIIPGELTYEKLITAFPEGDINTLYAYSKGYTLDDYNSYFPENAPIYLTKTYKNDGFATVNEVISLNRNDMQTESIINTTSENGAEMIRRITSSDSLRQGADWIINASPEQIAEWRAQDAAQTAIGERPQSPLYNYETGRTDYSDYKNGWVETSPGTWSLYWPNSYSKKGSPKRYKPLIVERYTFSNPENPNTFTRTAWETYVSNNSTGEDRLVNEPKLVETWIDGAKTNEIKRRFDENYKLSEYIYNYIDGTKTEWDAKYNSAEDAQEARDARERQQEINDALSKGASTGDYSDAYDLPGLFWKNNNDGTITWYIEETDNSGNNISVDIGTTTNPTQPNSYDPTEYKYASDGLIADETGLYVKNEDGSKGAFLGTGIGDLNIFMTAQGVMLAPKDAIIDYNSSQIIGYGDINSPNIYSQYMYPDMNKLPQVLGSSKYDTGENYYVYTQDGQTYTGTTKPEEGQYEIGKEGMSMAPDIYEQRYLPYLEQQQMIRDAYNLDEIEAEQALQQKIKDAQNNWRNYYDVNVAEVIAKDAIEKRNEIEKLQNELNNIPFTKKIGNALKKTTQNFVNFNPSLIYDESKKISEAMLPNKEKRNYFMEGFDESQEKLNNQTDKYGLPRTDLVYDTITGSVRSVDENLRGQRYKPLYTDTQLRVDPVYDQSTTIMQDAMGIYKPVKYTGDEIQWPSGMGGVTGYQESPEIKSKYANKYGSQPLEMNWGGEQFYMFPQPVDYSSKFFKFFNANENAAMQQRRFLGGVPEDATSNQLWNKWSDYYVPWDKDYSGYWGKSAENVIEGAKQDWNYWKNEAPQNWNPKKIWDYPIEMWEAGKNWYGNQDDPSNNKANAMQAFTEMQLNPIRDTWDAFTLGSQNYMKGWAQNFDAYGEPQYNGDKGNKFINVGTDIIAAPLYLGEKVTGAIRGAGHVPIAMVGNIQNNPFETMESLARGAPLAAAGIAASVPAYVGDVGNKYAQMGAYGAIASSAGNIAGALSSNQVSKNYSMAENVGGVGAIITELLLLNKMIKGARMGAAKSIAKNSGISLEKKIVQFKYKGKKYYIKDITDKKEIAKIASKMAKDERKFIKVMQDRIKMLPDKIKYDLAKEKWKIQNIGRSRLNTTPKPKIPKSMKKAGWKREEYQLAKDMPSYIKGTIAQEIYPNSTIIDKLKLYRQTKEMPLLAKRSAKMMELGIQPTSYGMFKAANLMDMNVPRTPEYIRDLKLKKAENDANFSPFDRYRGELVESNLGDYNEIDNHYDFRDLKKDVNDYKEDYVDSVENFDFDGKDNEDIEYIDINDLPDIDTKDDKYDLKDKDVDYDYDIDWDKDWDSDDKDRGKGSSASRTAYMVIYADKSGNEIKGNIYDTAEEAQQDGYESPFPSFTVLPIMTRTGTRKISITNRKGLTQKGKMFTKKQSSKPGTGKGMDIMPFIYRRNA